MDLINYDNLSLLIMSKKMNQKIIRSKILRKNSNSVCDNSILNYVLDDIKNCLDFDISYDTCNYIKSSIMKKQKNLIYNSLSDHNLTLTSWLHELPETSNSKLKAIKKYDAIFLEIPLNKELHDLINDPLTYSMKDKIFVKRALKTIPSDFSASTLFAVKYMINYLAQENLSPVLIGYDVNVKEGAKRDLALASNLLLLISSVNETIKQSMCLTGNTHVKSLQYIINSSSNISLSNSIEQLGGFNSIPNLKINPFLEEIIELTPYDVKVSLIKLVKLLV